MNVMSALDAFSSPRGSDPLDGITARAMAHSVLNLATDRPLPDQGRGIRRLYLIFDLVIVVLTALLVISFLRMRRRYRSWRTVLSAGAHFTLPLLIVYVVLKVPLWGVLVMLQPDLAYWLIAIAALLFVKGVIELTLMTRPYPR
jgi:hypothetical protein